MHLGAIIHTSRMLFFFCIVQTSFIVISGVEFDQNYFGVTFQPYVQHAENGSKIPSTTSYTRKNIETMMAVVSKKFSNVIVEDVFSLSETYDPFFTYVFKISTNLMSGDLAAKINRKNDNKTITLLYSVVLTSYKRNEASVSLAFEESEISNNIFPGTVEGVGIGQPTTLSEFQQVLHLLGFHRENASKLGLKLGVKLNCYTLDSPKNDTFADIQRRIINKSDFIICSSAVNTKAAITAFEFVSKSLARFKDFIHTINPSAEVIAMSEWYDNGLQEPQSSENLRDFWQAANDWAVNNKYRIYLREAFDNPWKDPIQAHSGWWKLKRNSEINSMDGYVEKVSELKETKAILSAIPNTTTAIPDIINVDNGDENTNEASGLSTLPVTIIASIATLIGVFSIVLFIYSKRNQKKYTAISSIDVDEFFRGNSGQQTRGLATVIDTAIGAPYDVSLDIPKESLKIDKKKILGRGEFGIVFKARIERESGRFDQVALKVTKDKCGPNTIKGFLSEIKILSYLGRHPNIVTLKGVYTAELAQGVVYVATELCELGSLERYLRKNGRMERNNKVNTVMKGMNVKGAQEMELTKVPSISMFDMVRWSHEIACGMKYLEEKHVVHADLAARNVLLTLEAVAKISDFGLSRRMYNYTNYVKKQQEPLPLRWMAIEALQKLEFSSKSDVWSYGITLWEIFSKGMTPYPGVSWTPSFVTKLVNGLRPDCPQFATPEIYNIMRDCWNFEADERPNFSELVDVTRIALDKCRVMGSQNILNINSN